MKRSRRGGAIRGERAFAAALVMAAVLGCGRGETPAGTEPVTARAELRALGGSGVSGEVRLTAIAEGVRIEAHANGLTPGKHGFHIHEWGDCSAVDGTSAGGHFNPEGAPHAGPDAPRAHAGDLGNLSAASDGHAMLERVSRRIDLGDGPRSVLGRAVIVHAGADDLTTQPTGAAGGRVACGVIVREEGETASVLPGGS